MDVIVFQLISLGFLWISFVFQWISLVFQWMPLFSNGFAWFPKDFIRFPMDFTGFPMDSLVFHEFHLLSMVLICFPIDFIGFPMDSIGFPIYFIALVHAMAFAQRKGKVAWIMWAGGSPPQLFRGGRWFTRSPPLESLTFMGGAGA